MRARHFSMKWPNPELIIVHSLKRRPLTMVKTFSLDISFFCPESWLSIPWPYFILPNLTRSKHQKEMQAYESRHVLKAALTHFSDFI